MEINNVSAQQPTLQTNVQDQAIGEQAAGLAQEGEQLNEAAVNASASLFFSLLQNILGEAQNNAGS